MASLSIESVYLGCAAVGGSVLILQTALLLVGHGDAEAGADVDHPDTPDHDGDSGLSLVSVRTVAAFLAFFGVAGWGGTRAGWDTLPTLATAIGTGLVMLFAVAWLFSLQRKLSAQGNLDPAGAVGRTARVYLRIPPANSGKGKIQVAVQGRTAELGAFTRADRELPTGSEVRVVRQVTPDTFEVEPLD